MVGIIPLPLTVIELETLAISKALQYDADLSLEDVTPEGVSEIAMSALNADSQSLESFGLLGRDVKCFASLFHCTRFLHVRREGFLYSHNKRNDNGVAYSLAKNALCIPDFQVWMEDVSSHIGSILQLDNFINKIHQFLSQKKKKKKFEPLLRHVLFEIGKWQPSLSIFVSTLSNLFDHVFINFAKDYN